MEIINQLRLTGVTDRFFFDQKKKRTYGFLRVEGIEKDVYLDFSICKNETKMFPHPGDLIDFSLDFSHIGPIANFWWFVGTPPTEYRVLVKNKFNSGQFNIISSGRIEELEIPENLNSITFSKREWKHFKSWEYCPNPLLPVVIHDAINSIDESLCG